MTQSKAQLFDNILSIIAQYKDGATLQEISESMAPPPLKRTLQRRLKDLKERGLVITQGQGRLTRYFVSLAKEEKIELSIYGELPLSTKGEAVRQIISKPLKERKQVNYNQDFLLNYIPNPLLSERKCSSPLA